MVTLGLRRAALHRTIRHAALMVAQHATLDYPACTAIFVLVIDS